MNKHPMFLTSMLIVMIITFATFLSPISKVEAGNCYRGSWIDKTWSNGEWHYFVAFETGPNNANTANWRITKKPRWVYRVQIWAAADWHGRVKAGIRPGIPWWYYLYAPWDFEICR